MTTLDDIAKYISDKELVDIEFVSGKVSKKMFVTRVNVDPKWTVIHYVAQDETTIGGGSTPINNIKEIRPSITFEKKLTEAIEDIKWSDKMEGDPYLRGFREGSLHALKIAKGWYGEYGP